MQHANLLSSLFLLNGLVALACSALLTRAMIFLYRKRAEPLPLYPSGWSAAQCRALEYFRLLIGLALVPLWGFFLAIAPTMRTTRWHLDIIFLIFLLLISNAWIVLLSPQNWKKFGIVSRSFWIMIIFLVVWWGTMFTATGWMLVKASTF